MLPMYKLYLTDGAHKHLLSLFSSKDFNKFLKIMIFRHSVNDALIKSVEKVEKPRLNDLVFTYDDLHIIADTYSMEFLNGSIIYCDRIVGVDVLKLSGKHFSEKNSFLFVKNDDLFH